MSGIHQIGQDDRKPIFGAGGWRIANKTANTTQSGLLYGQDLDWIPTRNGRIRMWSYYGSNVAIAGSALTVEISLDQGGTWLTLGTVAVGITRKVSAPSAAVLAAAFTAGVAIQVRFVTDASFTSTTADPQVWIEVEYD